MYIQELVNTYELYRREHFKNNRLIEVKACDLYLSIFVKCDKKFSKNKHETYIKVEYLNAGKRRYEYAGTGQCEDALIQNLTQKALSLFWEASGLPLKSLNYGMLPAYTIKLVDVDKK